MCVPTFVAYRFEAVFALHTGRTFSLAMEGLWKSRALGGRDACMDVGSLHMRT